MNRSFAKAEPRDHFVRDHEGSVPTRERGDRFQESGPGRDDAQIGRERFDQHGGDRRAVMLEELGERTSGSL